MTAQSILVLGIGNALCSDDGIGPRVVEELERLHPDHRVAQWMDGGTVGLALLTHIEGCSGLIIVDAAALDASPGQMQVFSGESMDRFVAMPRKRSVHEVGLADLLGAAALCGALPSRRALVAIQPASTRLGSEPTAEVGAAIGGACAAVLELLDDWQKQQQPPQQPRGARA